MTRAGPFEQGSRSSEAVAQVPAQVRRKSGASPGPRFGSRWFNQCAILAAASLVFSDPTFPVSFLFTLLPTLFSPFLIYLPFKYWVIFDPPFYYLFFYLI